MSDEDKVFRYDTEDIVKLLKKTWENNTLKFVVLFGEDDYFLGGMRKGDEYAQRTLNEIIIGVNNYGKLGRYLRLQDNSSYFYGIIQAKRTKGIFSFKLDIHRPKSGDITPCECDNYQRFVSENKAIINEDRCVCSLDDREDSLDNINNELTCSMSIKREAVVVFKGSRLPLRKKPKIGN